MLLTAMQDNPNQGFWQANAKNNPPAIIKESTVSPDRRMILFCEVFVERDRRRAFVAGAKLKLTAKTFLAAERRIPGLGNGVLQGILFQACIYLKRMFAALDEGVAERLFGTSLSFVRKIPPCAPPAVQAAMRAVEFVKSFAVLAHVQVARVALRAARGVEPLLVILENHEVEQAQ